MWKVVYMNSFQVEFSGYVCQLFATPKCSPAQRGVAAELTTAVSHQFLDRVKFVMKTRGSSFLWRWTDKWSWMIKQIWHVGGWAVKKVLNRAWKYIQRNIYTNCELSLALAKRQQTVCKLLEENVIQPFVEPKEYSEFTEMLEVTEGRQYRKRVQWSLPFLSLFRKEKGGTLELPTSKESVQRNGRNCIEWIEPRWGVEDKMVLLLSWCGQWTQGNFCISIIYVCSSSNSLLPCLKVTCDCTAEDSGWTFLIDLGYLCKRLMLYILEQKHIWADTPHWPLKDLGHEDWDLAYYFNKIAPYMGALNSTCSFFVGVDWKYAKKYFKPLHQHGRISVFEGL